MKRALSVFELSCMCSNDYPKVTSVCWHEGTAQGIENVRVQRYDDSIKVSWSDSNGDHVIYVDSLYDKIDKAGNCGLYVTADDYNLTD